MARIKEYVIDVPPVYWKKTGHLGRKFYEDNGNLSHHKIATTISLIAQHGDDPHFTSPIAVDITFYIAFPIHLSDRTATLWCSKFPLINNLQKFLFDEITQAGVIWKDERIVSATICRKFYDKHPRTHLVITELE